MFMRFPCSTQYLAYEPASLAVQSPLDSIKIVVEAGKEISLKRVAKIVVEAGAELTLKAGGSFVKVDASGVH